MKHTVYFEFFGKKMKTVVEAPDERQAAQQVIARVNILKIEKEEEEDPGFIKFFNEIVSGIRGKG